MSKKAPRKPDPIDAAFARARRELERLGAAYRANLDATNALGFARRRAGVYSNPTPLEGPWWDDWTDYELGLMQLQSPGGPLSGEPGHEHVAFLLIATDNLHELWNDSRPCGTEPDGASRNLMTRPPWKNGEGRADSVPLPF